MLPPPSSSSKTPISLAIVGGGIGGLCLAVALARQQHIWVHVYEAAPAFSEIGAGVGLGPNALRAMALLDPAIRAGYERCQTTNFASPEEQGRFFNFRYGMERPVGKVVAGQLICEVRSGGVTSSVHRARFLNELVRLMPEGVASFDKRLVGIDEEEGEGVLLRFADGTMARHDAVVGCDGVKSQVRKVLLGEGDKASEPVFSGHYCYRGLVPAEKAIEILGEDLATNSQMCKCRQSFLMLRAMILMRARPGKSRACTHDTDRARKSGQRSRVSLQKRQDMER